MLDMLHHLHTNFVNVFRIFKDDNSLVVAPESPVQQGRKVMFLNLELLVRVNKQQAIFTENAALMQSLQRLDFDVIVFSSKFDTIDTLN
mmetsp:Transcript_89722/g.194134  ORF Transcript_89722/g.194134 Transcript_89722/m.194134 type:complete len:89 (+) Transcript_89722:257-523(+)|eukprot:CAMPEP_0116918178 /NCGR_PEP_ID=MMETSP0467-20121206/19610_1 /TAXON_ID=283647 /ORGANISM="Mesodinium pulex, Strain SPMC105" /LENGTH=88 /DNA_ID=CAMNT_0004595465 /DNA_START=254 /DNA_END=520 /DNA_ORIENTATION=+